MHLALVKAQRFRATGIARHQKLKYSPLMQPNRWVEGAVNMVQRSCFLCVSFLAVAALTACDTSSGTPSFGLASGPTKSEPTVDNLVDHITCELSHAMYDHLHDPSGNINNLAEPIPSDDPRFVLWQRLVQDNFVASLTLQLQVTNSEGLNPSVNFIDPFNPIPMPTLTSTPSPFYGNLTLGISGQLDGSQYRTISVTYYTDFARLYELMKLDPKDSSGNDIKPTQNWPIDFDDKPLPKMTSALPVYIRGVERIDEHTKTPDGREKYHLTFSCDSDGMLGGNLGLEEILLSGLSALDRTKLYNVYAKPNAAQAAGAVGQGPVGIASALAQPQAKRTPNIEESAETTALLKVIVAQLTAITKSVTDIDVASRQLAASSLKTLTAPAASQPSNLIGSTVQFSITAGLSGGPNWTLRHFTGPNGSGGGGGGGKSGGSSGGSGSGGSGGSSGGGGGGAGQGFLNFNRNSVDMLTFQAAATCRADPGAKTRKLGEKAPTSSDTDYWESIPYCTQPEGEVARSSLLTFFQLRNAFQSP